MKGEGWREERNKIKGEWEESWERAERRREEQGMTCLYCDSTHSKSNFKKNEGFILPHSSKVQLIKRENCGSRKEFEATDHMA